MTPALRAALVALVAGGLSSTAGGGSAVEGAVSTAAAEPPQLRVRREIRIPDIPGYLTLKCDLHIHTVFSDGSVWPDVRPEEAWREGLDALAITDHIEYQPHAEDLPTNHERSFQIAKPRGDALDVLVIRGSEITRDMPPGHLNAIFLESVDPIDTELWPDAVAAAQAQGAFIFWNHPGWTGQQPDGVARWYEEHDTLLEAGTLHGIEVVNEREYYPEAHRWCLEKDLAILSNSDIHAPINMDYLLRQGDLRPITLVFAKERSLEGIREALLARRTAAYAGGKLIGKEAFLQPIFEDSVQVLNGKLSIDAGGDAYVRIHNGSDIRFDLNGSPSGPGLTLPGRVVLPANRTALLRVATDEEAEQGPRQLELAYTVSNLLVAPGEGLKVTLPLEVVIP